MQISKIFNQTVILDSRWLTLDFFRQISVNNISNCEEIWKEKPATSLLSSCSCQAESADSAFTLEFLLYCILSSNIPTGWITSTNAPIRKCLLRAATFKLGHLWCCVLDRICPRPKMRKNADRKIVVLYIRFSFSKELPVDNFFKFSINILSF